MHVGMNRIYHIVSNTIYRVPHARGDEPIIERIETITARSSPCTWG